MQFTAKRVTVAAAVAVGIACAIGATVLATAADPVAPEVFGATPAEAGHENQGRYTTGDYVLNVHEPTGDGEGRTTAIGPHTTYYSKTLHGTGNPAVLRFSVGSDADAPVVFSYPVPAPGRGVDCVASGTEASPRVWCETTR